MKITILSAALLLAAAALPALAKSPMPAAPVAPPAKAVSAPLDLNSASLADLKALKGVGDVRAQAIVKGRPWKGKDELVQKGVLPKAVYDGIKADVVARQK